MIRLSEEQKMILNCYEGGRTKVIHEIERSIEELRSTGEEPEMLELLEDLAAKLEACTNREFFQAKKEALIDPVSDLDVLDAADVPVDE
ncbi:MAG: transposon-transfer assisting family protein [Eubacteriales bacterium]|nr:transposon-transfer assisting family protein [Eubacteriales bacterium]